MPSQGPNSGGTFVDDASIGTITWSNPGNAVASDNAYATAVLATSDVSHYLKATNFGFSIPTNDMIVTGILVEIERSGVGTADVQDSQLKIVKAGNIGGSQMRSSTAWPTTDTIAAYGGNGELWGLLWTPDDINAANFGVALAATDAAGANTAQVDQIRITVFYAGSNRIQSQAGNHRVNSGGMGQPDWVS